MNKNPIELSEIRVLKKARTEVFPFCLFLYVLEGECTASFTSEPLRLSSADLLFLPGNRALTLTPSESCRMLYLGIAGNFLDDYLDARPLTPLTTVLDPDLDFMPLKRDVLKAASSNAAGEDQSASDLLRLRSTIFHLLASLSDLLADAGRRQSPGRYMERVQAIADYIDLHYAENFTLSDLAGAFYLTPQYLSTFFREHFSDNFKTYVTKKRLHYALRDLRNTSAPISEIALRHGFSSVSAFQKNFRKIYGCAPTEYRSAQLQDESGGSTRSNDEAGQAGLSAAEAEASGRHGARSGAAAEAAEPGRHGARSGAAAEAAEPGHRGTRSGADAESPAAVTSAGASFILQAGAEPVNLPHVNTMINVGSVQNLLSDRYRLHLLSFCKQAHIRYVRIEEMLSNSFMPMILPHYEYFYQNADIVLSFLYEHDLIPFIELSRIEVREGRGGELLRERPFIPRNARFFKLLESFLKHVSRRWPVSWLRNWHFEMWLLPRDTAAAYTADLIRVRDLIRSLIPGAEVGGPGYDRAIHTLSPEDLLDAFRDASFRPDFFSVSLHYQKKRSGTVSSVSPDPDQLIRDCRHFRSCLKKRGANLPLYVTEWSSADLLAAPAAASRYQAAFIARTWPALDELCDLAGFWLFNDMENTMENNQTVLYHFGRGLFANGFVPCAAYYAYILCASLGSGVIANRSSCRFVRAEEHHYQLLAFHYAHFQTAPDPENGEQTDFDRVYTLFEDLPPMSFSAEITGLMPGLYHTTRTVIDAQHGSILDILIGEFTHSNIDRIEFLQNVRVSGGITRAYRVDSCLPVERSSYQRIRGTLKISFEMPPHTVCLWDIQRLI